MRDLAAAASSACCCCSDYLRPFMAIREVVFATEADFRLPFSGSLPRCITATAAFVAVSKSVRLKYLAVFYTAAPALCRRLQCATRSVSCNDSNVHVVVQNQTLQHATETAKQKTPGVKTNNDNAQS